MVDSELGSVVPIRIIIYIHTLTCCLAHLRYQKESRRVKCF